MTKYRNIKTIVDGVKFDSKLEALRYKQLCLKKQYGQIKDFELQKRFNLSVNGQKICTYVCDFYIHELDGTFTVEDTKGVLTRDFKIKQKLMKAIFGIEIKIITSKQ